MLRCLVKCMCLYILIYTLPISIFPKCQPVTKDICIFLVDLESSAMFISTSEFLPPLNITSLHCREDFFEQNFTCLPRCDRWDGRAQNALVATADIVRVICAILRTLFTLLLIVVFVVRRKAL